MVGPKIRGNQTKSTLIEQPLRADCCDGMMNTTTVASSISKAILNLPEASILHGRVLGRHRHAFNIELAAGRDSYTATAQIITLADDVIGNGPLNIVVNDLLAVRASDMQYNEIWFSERHLRFGGCEISLTDAVIWDPSPDWQRLCATCELSTKRLDWMLEVGRRYAPAGSLLDYLSPVSLLPGPGTFEIEFMNTFSDILRNMETGDQTSLQDGAATLAGLGNGLTPAGDDFLFGIMLFIWLRCESAATICQPLADSAEHRTTRLSACLLNQAALGNCSCGWHRLLESIATNVDVVIERNIAALLSYGHTSGADALAGFIWASRHEHSIV